MARNKVEKELCDAGDIKSKRKEEEQEYLTRICTAISDISDDDWDGLSEKAQEWYNEASDAINAEEDIVGFQDEPAVEKRTTAKESKKVLKDVSVEDLEEEMMVRVELTNGKVHNGEIVEIEEKSIILEDEKENEILIRKRKIEIITLTDADDPEDDPEDEEDPEKEEKPTRKSKTADKTESKKESKPPKKVSATLRIRTIACENIEIDFDDAYAQLLEEGYTCKESTAQGTFLDAKKTIEILQNLDKI